MKHIATIMWNEWKVFFHSPFAVVILPLYFVISGTIFYSKLKGYMNIATPSETIQQVRGLSVMNHLLTPFYEEFLMVFIFIIPLITMRTLAEEKRSGTYELLVSYPVTPHAILFGKFLGIVMISLGLLACSMMYPALIIWRGEPYVTQIATTYLGYALFLILYTAIGVVASGFTENQLISALLTYLTFFAMMLFKLFAFVSVAPFDQFFGNFLVIAHLNSFHSGLIFLGDIAVFVCLTVLVLLIGYAKLRRHYVS